MIVQVNNGGKFDETGLFHKQKFKVYGKLRTITYERMSFTCLLYKHRPSKCCVVGTEMYAC